MTETKSAAFHRLAGKRVEDIEDKLRIFSNLSGPSYEWVPAEVEAYLERIHAGVEAARARFAETKRWQQSAPSEQAEARPMVGLFNTLTPEQQDQVLAYDGPESHGDPQILRDRQSVMIDVWREAGEDAEILAEMNAMQREVIASLQSILDDIRARGGNNGIVVPKHAPAGRAVEGSGQSAIQ